jgi:outer membrane lipoprotein-sorting protein
MRTFRRKLLAPRGLDIFVVALFLVLTGVSNGVGQFKIGSVLETEKRQVFDLMTKRYKTLVTARGYASFTRQTAQLDVPPEKRTGIFKHVTAGSMSRVDLFSPAETLSISNGSYTFYRPKEKEAFTGSMTNGSVNAARAYVLEIVFADPEMYQRDFRTIYLGKATINAGVPVYQLMLTPLKDPGRHPIELWVDMDGMPIQVRVTEKNGDSSTLLFTNIYKNKKIKGSEFAVKFKKQTKVVSE